MNFLKTGLVLIIAAGVLAACGGGGGDSYGYGAVAVSASTHQVAISSAELTQSIANDEARDDCGVWDCEVIQQFKECGAAAQGTTTGGTLIITGGDGDTELQAQTVANNACIAQGATACGPVPNVAARCN